LHFGDCDLDVAIRLNRLWHSVLPKVVRSNITRCSQWASFSADFDNHYFAAAIWTNPTARYLPVKEWLELRRFAISPDAPRNTASRMLSWMHFAIAAIFPNVSMLISYQDCDKHTGAIYRASGWKDTVKSFDHRDRGMRSGRKRNLSQTTATKQRWEYELRSTNGKARTEKHVPALDL
jgi:hypothetical protein